jgi:pimeloyl-ACP methyl ester carboxylesterase
MRTLLLLPIAALLFTVFGPTATVAALPALPLYSARYGDGLALEIAGDLGPAATVVVLVPGVNTSAANFDSGLGGVQRRAPAWQAHRLYDAIGGAAGVGGAGGAGGVAVVAWLGYHPPSGVNLAAVREDRAAAGANALREFVTRLPGRRIVLVGHSYGSTVLGLAAAAGLDPRVTDLIALGSPGLGVDHAADLHTGARVWAGTAATDWTRRVPAARLLGAGHGAHPYDPSFGALPIPVAGVDGHDGYFAPGSATLQALAEISTTAPTGRLAP